MSQRLLLIAGIFAFALCGGGSPASAQWSSMFQQEEETPEPPQELPPLPEDAQDYELEPEMEQADTTIKAADYYRQQRRKFPPLPPARPCLLTDMVGIWRLVNVYEEPEGNATASFRASRHQYMMFNKDNTYGKYSSATVSLPAAMVETEISRQQQGLQQYLVNEMGIVYFYNQGVAVDSLACFIVANERGPYAVGQMILMPPKGQHQGRLVKLYARYGSKEQDKPKKRRRGRRR